MVTTSRSGPRAAGSGWPSISQTTSARVPPMASLSSAKVKTASIKRHYVWPRYRIASWYTSHLRYADVAPAAWQHYYSARPVLLMVGIAY